MSTAEQPAQPVEQDAAAAGLDEFPRWQVGWFVGGFLWMAGTAGALPAWLASILTMAGSATVTFNAYPALFDGRPWRRRR